MNNNKAQILLVDDHAMVRHGLSSLINAEQDMEVIAEADCAKVALQKLMEVKAIDIVLLDLTLEEGDDLSLINVINEQFPNIPVLIVSMHNEKVYARRALQVGARGYVMKAAPGDVLVSAIRDVLQGKIYLSPEMTSYIINQNIKGKSDSDQPIDKLSRSEFEILKMIAAGFSSVEIANMTNRSVKTIETHRANMRVKLNLKDGADLVRFALLNTPPLF